MTQHCTITGTMLVPVHYIVCTLKKKNSEITVFVVVKINSFQCQCQCQTNLQPCTTKCIAAVYNKISGFQNSFCTRYVGPIGVGNVILLTIHVDSLIGLPIGPEGVCL